MRLRRATRSEVLRLRAIADYQFGYPAGDLLIPDDVIVGISPATRRIREIYGSEGLLAVLRAHDYLYSLSINGARRLLALPEPRLRAIVNSNEISKSIPCYKIISIDEELRPGDEVIILSEEKELLGIGRLRLSPLEIREGCGSEAIRVRKRVRKEE
ncbi:hypothetical protein PYJP_19370 [Pyrofollis japonicus]|uniref:PUA domain-containing protein n=1 Tax=Pyrofollis japonicus TaxID=3060460 RepID=UPI00295ADC3E|nr:PUA domain-containing protein [Pyrofollis japonicus]BEP18585.1 hypothetical protein PYJP_19370 [Pyrofollis japonicus]